MITAILMGFWFLLIIFTVWATHQGRKEMKNDRKRKTKRKKIHNNKY
jgi:hypothetical protein